MLKNALQQPNLPLNVSHALRRITTKVVLCLESRKLFFECLSHALIRSWIISSQLRSALVFHEVLSRKGAVYLPLIGHQQTLLSIPSQNSGCHL